MASPADHKNWGPLAGFSSETIVACICSSNSNFLQIDVGHFMISITLDPRVVTTSSGDTSRVLMNISVAPIMVSFMRIKRCIFSKRVPQFLSPEVTATADNRFDKYLLVGLRSKDRIGTKEKTRQSPNSNITRLISSIAPVCSCSPLILVLASFQLHRGYYTVGLASPLLLNGESVPK